MFEPRVDELASQPSYWNLLPPEEFAPFLEEVKTKGWKHAILASNNPKIKELYLFTDCPSRADGTFYLSLNQNSSVLDLGSGWGSYTFALAPRVKEVVAADSSLESLQFISLRAQQDKRPNISAVHIDPLDYGKLPFKTSRFDAVIMNGVLEWVGSYLKTGDPLKIQENCLKEVHRVLKGGGELWIGIENRFGLRYFQGAPDDHLLYYSKEKKVAYTSLLPRFIASIISGRTIGVSYRTYTHSLWGYQRLLKRVGFSESEFYYPTGDYRAASTKILPLASQEVQKKWLCDSYFIRARN